MRGPSPANVGSTASPPSPARRTSTTATSAPPNAASRKPRRASAASTTAHRPRARGRRRARREPAARREGDRQIMALRSISRTPFARPLADLDLDVEGDAAAQDRRASPPGRRARRAPGAARAGRRRRWPAARTTMSPISRPGALGRAAGGERGNEQAGRRRRRGLAGRPPASGTGCAPMPSQGRATWPLASSAATTRDDGRRRHDDAVAARQRGRRDADHRAAGIGDRRAREAVVDAAVEPDQPIEAAAEPGLPRAGGAVDDARRWRSRRPRRCGRRRREMAGAHAARRRRWRPAGRPCRRYGEAKQGDVGRRIDADQRRLDALPLGADQRDRRRRAAKDVRCRHDQPRLPDAPPSRACRGGRARRRCWRRRARRARRARRNGRQQPGWTVAARAGGGAVHGRSRLRADDARKVRACRRRRIRRTAGGAGQARDRRRCARPGLQARVGRRAAAARRAPALSARPDRGSADRRAAPSRRRAGAG